MVALYVLHPEYTPDPHSQKYELHNIAVITLLCPIPAQVGIAVKLPTQQYSDIGHMCCSEKCKLLTVIENTQNYHFVKEMRIRNVPRPVHKEKTKEKESGMDLNIMHINQLTQRENQNYKRLVRSPGIAPAPQFFTQDKLNIKSKPKKHKGRKKNDFPISLRGRGNVYAHNHRVMFE
ncbi:PREDICTED: uncharacterized protein LOC105361062 [Ceratosolen solmsi marchali]|uniref:Uncharacterized protein LOC105361062 n=1 Tax=Ceratosolen solmsi marchali TaxID=326594 RepID=A0AAJ6YE95_9HYME|nr:PREDICTED: uncharacterized protein LOC105361062 [Ceratosolen solmsi marchali]